MSSTYLAVDLKIYLRFQFVFVCPFCISISLTTHHFIFYLCLSMPLSISFCLSMPLSISFCLSMPISVFPPVHLYILLFVPLSVHLCILQSLYICRPFYSFILVYSSNFRSPCLCLSVHFSIYLRVCLSINLYCLTWHTFRLRCFRWRRSASRSRRWRSSCWRQMLKNFFLSSITARQNKLERLSWASWLTIKVWNRSISLIRYYD